MSDYLRKINEPSGIAKLNKNTNQDKKKKYKVSVDFSIYEFSNKDKPKFRLVFLNISFGIVCRWIVE